MPKEFLAMRELLISNLWRSPEHWDVEGLEEESS
jgi:phosphoenolpyruvate carboxykinase (GTP)